MLTADSLLCGRPCARYFTSQWPWEGGCSHGRVVDFEVQKYQVTSPNS